MAEHQVQYTMTPVRGLPEVKRGGGAARQVYVGLFERIAQAHDAGLFNDPEVWIEVARYGGKNTASTAVKNIKDGTTDVGEAPEGCSFFVTSRTTDLEDGTRSVLYARVDRAEEPVVELEAEDDQADDQAEAEAEDPEAGEE